MALDRCRHCGYLFLLDGDRANHKCPPEWEVWWPDGSEERDDARTFHASSAREAAEKWAQWSDSQGDYTIVGGSPETVCVAAPGKDEVVRFYSEGYTVAEYHATEEREA
jgi:hypothetical protein